MHFAVSKDFSQLKLNNKTEILNFMQIDSK